MTQHGADEQREQRVRTGNPDTGGRLYLGEFGVCGRAGDTAGCPGRTTGSGGIAGCPGRAVRDGDIAGCPGRTAGVGDIAGCPGRTAGGSGHALHLRNLYSGSAKACGAIAGE